MFLGEELKQYSRQIRLPEIGLSGQQKLKKAKVLMIGAGGLGCPVLQYLVAAGVGEIGIVDHDVVDVTNLHRQILYTIADVGRPKATVAKQKLELLNPHVSVTAFPELFSTANAESLCANYDLVMDGSDNFETRYLINDTVVALNKVLVFGSIFKFEGHISVFNYQNGPDYRDVFPEPPSSTDVPNCAEIGVLGVLPGIVGAYMANEAIKIICNIGEVLSGKLMVIDTLNISTSIFKITKQKSRNEKYQKLVNVQNNALNYEITKDKLDAWLSESPESICLIDVRETYEFEEDNSGGINIPLHNLKDCLDEIPLDKRVVFCCQTGQRGKIAIQLLKNIVKGEMYSLKHGFNED
jgi:molybdopterin/thiamine biosynthesis adenylyltransferase/rhodanese-related sulfurtransferase